MPNGHRKITAVELSRYFHMPERAVAKELGMCLTSLKKFCRQNGITRWPYRKLKSLDRRIARVEQNMQTSGGKEGSENPQLLKEWECLRAQRMGALPVTPSTTSTKDVKAWRTSPPQKPQPAPKAARVHPAVVEERGTTPLSSTSTSAHDSFESSGIEVEMPAVSAPVPAFQFTFDPLGLSNFVDNDVMECAIDENALGLPPSQMTFEEDPDLWETPLRANAALWPSEEHVAGSPSPLVGDDAAVADSSAPVADPTPAAGAPAEGKAAAPAQPPQPPAVTAPRAEKQAMQSPSRLALSQKLQRITETHGTLEAHRLALKSASPSPHDSKPDSRWGEDCGICA